MSRTYTVAVIIGSLRKGAYSRMAANTLIELAPNNLKLEIVEILDLTFFNQDLEDTPPLPWVELRNRIHDVDSVIFCTPEYNRSMPPPLKNAIDIGSRGQNVWSEKPVGIVSTSPGALGGVSADMHLRQTLVNVNATTMAQPDVNIGHVHKLIDDSGHIVDEGTRKYLATFLTKFAEWVERHVKD